MADYSGPDETTFIFTKTFEDYKEYPFADSLALYTFIVITYLLLTLKIIPDYMKTREAFNLKNTILIYNALQVFFSAYFTYLSFKIMMYTGLMPKKCCEGDPKIRKEISYCIYVYLLGKISELFDTIFFVLRKKYNQVSFLHVYHHASVVLGTWLVFKYAQSHSSIYGVFINSLVHVVMYFYYGVSALGPEFAKYVTWKRHITNFQRIQFITIILYQTISCFYTICDHPVVGVLYIGLSPILFLVLFTNFYTKTYVKRSIEERNRQNGELALGNGNKKLQ